ncbi:hypothetical protein HPP92_019621 [Vanilla planifolia]|uniref:Uncharacterized protein n=1 Tax=Vanilla planifolia TaxID=51239 RepID=A0A835UJ33_VANPL|nr:hypothetical protein HPP92_019621 [Vanilla planifolia]
MAEHFPKILLRFFSYGDKANASGRRPCSKESSSSSISSTLLASSKSNSSSIPRSSSSSSSSSSSTPRRFRSPPQNPMPKTPSTLPRRRSQSVDRYRPATAGAGSYLESIVAVREALRTTTKELKRFLPGRILLLPNKQSKAHTPKARHRLPEIHYSLFWGGELPAERAKSARAATCKGQRFYFCLQELGFLCR